MAEDFLGGLGETLSKTAKDLGSKADMFIETQKLRSKITTEERMVDKCMADLGRIIYKRHIDGEALDMELSEVCEEITRHKVQIARQNDKIAKMKGQKVCPACGASIDREAAFCMQCGAPCGTEDDEPETASEESAPEAKAEDDVKVQEETPESVDDAKSQDEAAPQPEAGNESGNPQ